MTDPQADAVGEALYNLRELTMCRCHADYKNRGRIDPECNHNYREDVEAIATRLEASEREAALWRKWLPWLNQLNRKPFNLAKDIDAAMRSQGVG